MTPTRKGDGRLLRLKGGQGAKTRWYHWITSPRDGGVGRQGKVPICCDGYDGGVDLCGLLKDSSGEETVPLLPVSFTVKHAWK